MKHEVWIKCIAWLATWGQYVPIVLLLSTHQLQTLNALLVFLPAGSVDLTHSNVLYRDLSKGLEGLLLNSLLHLVYLVTPYDTVSQCKPDWMIYFRQVRTWVQRRLLRASVMYFLQRCMTESYFDFDLSLV